MWRVNVIGGERHNLIHHLLLMKELRENNVHDVLRQVLGLINDMSQKLRDADLNILFLLRAIK